MRRLVPAFRAIVSTAGRRIACGSSSFPGGLERRLFILSRAGIFLDMRVLFPRAWVLRFPFLPVLMSSVLSWHPMRCSCRRRASAAVMSRVLALILIISSIISCGEVGRSCRPRVLLHLIGVLSSHLGRLSCSGRRALPLISPCVSFSLSWGKRRGI